MDMLANRRISVLGPPLVVEARKLVLVDEQPEHSAEVWIWWVVIKIASNILHRFLFATVQQRECNDPKRRLQIETFRPITRISPNTLKTYR